MANLKVPINNNKLNNKRGNSFLFYGLLLYTIIYYSQIGSRIPPLGKIRIELLLGSLLLLVGIPQFIKKITNNDEEKRILYPIYFFFFAALISIPTTVAGYHTIDMLMHLLKSWAILIMIYAGINTEKQLKYFIYIFLIMHGIIIAESFFLSLSGSGFKSDGGGLLRLRAATGLFAHPNSLGSLCARTLPLAYFLFIHEKSWLKKLILVALGLITLKVITLTESRTALVGVMSFIFFIWFINKKKVLFALVIFIALLSGWASLDTVTKNRYLSILDADEVVLGEKIRNKEGEQIRRGSMEKRYKILTDGLTLFLQRPITGFGIGGFQIARIERLGRYQVAHNTYIQCLAEVGIVGFVPWFLLLANTFILLSKTRKIITESGERDDCRFIYQMSYAFQGYLTVLSVNAIFGHNPYGIYWWIPAAISLTLVKLIKDKRQAKTL